MGSDNDNPWGLLIPIAVLLIVMFGIGEAWLLLPIFILGIILISGIVQNSRINARKREYDHWKAPETGGMTSGYISETSKPIYDQKKQKDQGITCGTFIPIIFVGWLFLETQSWVFLIPLAFLFAPIIETIANQGRGKAKVRDQLKKDNIRTVQDIADSTGMTEEKVRRYIVTEKRSGQTDVWFDPKSGEVTHSPGKLVEQTPTKTGCSYCGFALKSEDRFCPYCGAPIKA